MTILVGSAALTAHANAIRKLGKRVISDVIEIGRHLTEAKAEVKKLGGSWADWLKAEFEWGETQSRRFIEVYEWSKSATANLAKSDLPLSAIYLLAAPETSPKARAEIAERVKKGEKVKHKEVAKTVRKHKRSGPRQPDGLRARIIDVVKAAPAGLITEQIKQQIRDVHPQTVNSTTNGLAKQGWLRDSGERRQGSAEGGRRAIVYVYEPNPQPKARTAPKKSGKIVDFELAKLVLAIENESICKAITEWMKGKTRQQCAEKAYRLIIPLVGNTRGGIGRIADVQARDAAAANDGRVIATIELQRKH